MRNSVQCVWRLRNTTKCTAKFYRSFDITSVPMGARTAQAAAPTTPATCGSAPDNIRNMTEPGLNITDDRWLTESTVNAFHVVPERARETIHSAPIDKVPQQLKTGCLVRGVKPAGEPRQCHHDYGSSNAQSTARPEDSLGVFLE